MTAGIHCIKPAMPGELAFSFIGSATMGGFKTIRFGLMLSGAAAMLGGLCPTSVIDG
jgi:hypothetical protein